MDKTKTLRLPDGDYDAAVRLSNLTNDLSWWITNIMSSLQHVHVPDPGITIYTDSGTLGWGVTDGKNPSGGRWKTDGRNHINVLELKAILMSADILQEKKLQTS